MKTGSEASASMTFHTMQTSNGTVSKNQPNNWSATHTYGMDTMQDDKSEEDSRAYSAAEKMVAIEILRKHIKRLKEEIKQNDVDPVRFGEVLKFVRKYKIGRAHV